MMSCWTMTHNRPRHQSECTADTNKCKCKNHGTAESSTSNLAADTVMAEILQHSVWGQREPALKVVTVDNTNINWKHNNALPAWWQWWDNIIATVTYRTYPFDAHCSHMGTAIIKHPVPDRVKPSFVIFDIQALWRSALSVKPWASECPDVKKLQMTA